MKKYLSFFISVILVLSTFSIINLTYAGSSKLNMVSAIDLTVYSQNAVRIYFDQNLTCSEADLTIANIQALKSGNQNYNTSVVNGVLDGIRVNNKTIREWNIYAGGDYGLMVHYYRENGNNFIAIYADPSLVNFSNGLAHFISINSKFTSYNSVNASGGAYLLEPIAMNWEVATTNILRGLDLTGYQQNAMRIYFDQNLTNLSSNGVLTHIQALKPQDSGYDETVVNGVLDGIIIDGSSVREINTQASSDYAVMVHFYYENGHNFLAIYVSSGVADFTDGQTHTIVITELFKGYTMRSVSETTLYQDKGSRAWSLSPVAQNYSWDPYIAKQSFRQVFSWGAGTWMGVDNPGDPYANYWRVSTTNEDANYNNGNSDQINYGDSIWPFIWSKTDTWIITSGVDKYNVDLYRDKHTFAGLNEAFGFDASIPMPAIKDDVYVEFQMMLSETPLGSSLPDPIGSSKLRATIGFVAEWNGRSHYLEFNLWNTENYDNVTTNWNKDNSPPGQTWRDNSDGIFDRRAYSAEADCVYYRGNRLDKLPGMFTHEKLNTLTGSPQYYNINVSKVFRLTPWSDNPTSWDDINISGIYLGVEVWGGGRTVIAFNKLRVYTP